MKLPEHITSGRILNDRLKALGSDKWVHPFGDVYYPLFLSMPDIKAVLEIGVNAGGSLKAWSECLPSADIFGIDIRDPLDLGNPKIHIAKADQNTKESLVTAVQAWGASFDIIIEDGCHVMFSQMWDLAWLFPFLRPGGVYCLEDLHTSFHGSYGGNMQYQNTALRSLLDWQCFGRFESTYLKPEETKMLTESIANISLFSAISGHWGITPMSVMAIIQKKG